MSAHGRPIQSHVIRPRVALVLASLACIAGCGAPLYGYKSVRDSELYIADATREAIVSQGLSREQLIEQLGEGTYESANSIEYARCIKSTGWGLMGPGDVESCQWAVFWFDEQGRVIRQTSTIGKCTYGSCESPTSD